MDETHSSPYSEHPGGDTLYMDMKQTFWWPNRKLEVAEFMAKCLTCQKVKFEYKSPQDKSLQKALEFVNEYNFSSSYKWANRTNNSDFRRYVAISCYGLPGSPVCWNDISETVVLGHEFLEEMVKQVKVIEENIKATQDRQKSYADWKQRDEQFQVGEKLRKWLSKRICNIVIRMNFTYPNISSINYLSNQMKSPEYMFGFLTASFAASDAALYSTSETQLIPYIGD
ncbi:uncharacterized protein LOC104901298 [Beta vulgaris subsp. vulgaris]|uniref:uncharacterized protein LOC104901298 n=1 Tax=Beta vulgaris subsp. vulgaris TaxID=3555 RepID=UPI00053F5257|nr:uncharacterized protein LOC104901298 [Beta vulgaris subsp. vulgaris]